MSETLCTLRGAGGGGGRYKETSLWTNQSPSSNFSAQTITLSDNLSNYKYVAIRYKYSPSTSDTDYSTDILSVDDFKKCIYNPSAAHNSFALLVQAVNNNLYARTVFYDTDTSIQFTNYTQIGGTGSGVGNTIPLEILGLNELDHGTKYTTNASEIAFKSVSANTIPTFTTVAEAKAIWLTLSYTSAYRTLQITNVNPTTGEVNNNSLYKIDTSSMGNIEPLTGNKFIVTSNSVTMESAPSTAATRQSLIYTY